MLRSAYAFLLLTVSVLCFSNILSATEIRQLQDQIASKDRSISSLRSEVRELENRMNNVRREIGALEQESDRLFSQKERMEADFNAKLDQMENTKQATLSCINEYNICRGNMERCKRDLIACSQRGPDNLQKLSQVKAYNQQIQQIHARIIQLQEQIRGYNRQLDNLKNEVDNMCSQIKSCNQRLSEIQNQADSILDTVQELRTRIDNLKSQISYENREKEGLLVAISKAKTKVSDVQSSTSQRTRGNDSGVQEFAPIDIAWQAVAYVKSKLKLGASNKWSDVAGSAGVSAGCVVFERLRRKITGRLGTRQIARDAERAGCGNCGEQAAVAWTWLVDQKGIVPVDYMVNEKEEDYNSNHAFVVIGRKEGSDLQEPSTWGRNAAVCDPWANKCYLASELKKKMDDVQKLNSWVRN